MKNRIIIVLLCLACGLFSCTQTDSSTTAKELTPDEIAEEIHTISRSGLRGNSETLMKCMEMIDENNVPLVTDTYIKIYGNGMLNPIGNTSIFNAIAHNIFISAKTRAQALRHVKDMLIKFVQGEGVYTDDLNEMIEGHIKYEKNKFGRMKSKDIDEETVYLWNRYYQVKHNENILYPANGKIDDEFKQKNMPDCWLLAAIKSLSVNPKGQEMLNDLISLDEKGNVTVKLKGVNKEYTISKEELEGANELAEGDLDVRAIECAIRKFYHEIGDHIGIFRKIKTDIKFGMLSHEYESLLNGALGIELPYCILFDLDSLDTEVNEELIEKIKSGDYSTIVNNLKSGYEVEGFNKHHAHAAIDADDTYVYLSEPYNPDTILTMTHEDFLKFFDMGFSMHYKKPTNYHENRAVAKKNIAE